MFPQNDRLQSAYAFRERHSGEELANIMELHFVELPKYQERPRALRTRLEKWLHILKFGELYGAVQPLPDDIQIEKELIMAMKELRRVNADEQMRAILEQRDKEERIHLTKLKDAEERGVHKGRAEGLAEERLIVARRMLSKGFDLASISEITGLSEAELATLTRTE